MRVQCVQCESFSLQKAGAMAREGFGVCLKDPSPGAYYPASYERDCDKFAQAEQSLTDKCIQWLEKRRWAVSE